MLRSPPFCTSSCSLAALQFQFAGFARLQFVLKQLVVHVALLETWKTEASLVVTGSLDGTALIWQLPAPGDTVELAPIHVPCLLIVVCSAHCLSGVGFD